MTLLDVIYVNYNSTSYLINSIETLFRHYRETHNLHIVVVDNSSEDNSLQLMSHFPGIQLILNKKNVGFGAAINQALVHCNSKYIIFLNPDSYVTAGFIETCMHFMDQNDKIGVVGPMILDEDGSVQGSARAFPTPLTSLFGRSSPITKMFPNNSITKSNILTLRDDKQTTMDVDWVSGACMFVRREAMKAVGSFDERFFLYWEDTDFCRRIWDCGWKVVYFPGIKVVHSVGKSSGTRPMFANYQFHKSSYLLYKKYAKWPFSIIAPVAGIALMLRFVSSVFFDLLRSKFDQVLNIRKHNKIKKPNGDGDGDGKIRLLRVLSRMNIGGPSIHVNNLTEAFNNQKYKTILVTGTVSSNEGDMSYITNYDKDVRIIIPELQREISLCNDLIALYKLIHEIWRFKPDIIHSHTSKAGAVSRLAAMLYRLFRNKKIITVHTYHGNILNGYFGKFQSFLFLLIERILAKMTDKIVAISDSQKWELVNTFKIIEPEKVSVINLGFDLQPFKDANQHRGRLRKRLDLSDDDILIGLIGRMAPIKNHKMFLDAAKKLIERSPNIKLKFILVGDGEERSFLERYVDTIGIKQDVIFYGWEKEIPMVYADIDILALTSKNEGTPVSVIEAMAASVPVVTTGVGGIKDLLGKFQSEQPRKTDFKICERGILCPKDDPIGFCEGMSFMIESGYLLDKCRLTNAMEHVTKNYSMGRLVDDIDVLYKRLTANSIHNKTE